jgi:hypothetical protein
MDLYLSQGPGTPQLRTLEPGKLLSKLDKLELSEVTAEKLNLGPRLHILELNNELRVMGLYLNLHFYLDGAGTSSSTR